MVNLDSLKGGSGLAVWYLYQEPFFSLHQIPICSRVFVNQRLGVLKENPKWYMQKEPTRDCAGRGGCCGRGCGCCEKRESTPGGNMGVGHCTTGCGCCSNFWGYELTKKEMGDIRGALRATLKYSRIGLIFSHCHALTCQGRRRSILLTRRWSRPNGWKLWEGSRYSWKVAIDTIA